MIFSNDIPLFTAHGLGAFLLREKDAPKLQKLLERCSDYFDMVEGRRPRCEPRRRACRGAI
jgi:hypothetical protein